MLHVESWQNAQNLVLAKKSANSFKSETFFASFHILSDSKV